MGFRFLCGKVFNQFPVHCGDVIGSLCALRFGSVVCRILCLSLPDVTIYSQEMPLIVSQTQYWDAVIWDPYSPRIKNSLTYGQHFLSGSCRKTCRRRGDFVMFTDWPEHDKLIVSSKSEADSDCVYTWEVQLHWRGLKGPCVSFHTQLSEPLTSSTEGVFSPALSASTTKVLQSSRSCLLSC